MIPAKQKLASIAGTALAVALIACIPFGLLMAWYMDNGDWLIFCATVFLFMS